MTTPAANDSPSARERAYERLLERVQRRLDADAAAEDAVPRIAEAVARERDAAVAAGELAPADAQAVAASLQRDLEHAGEFLADERVNISDWLRFDLELIEARVLDMLARATDHSRVELASLSERGVRSDIWQAGEVTAPGRLRCVDCNREIHLHRPRELQPCPACGGTRFSRDDTAKQ